MPSAGPRTRPGTYTPISARSDTSISFDINYTLPVTPLSGSTRPVALRPAVADGMPFSNCHLGIRSLGVFPSYETSDYPSISND